MPTLHVEAQVSPDELLQAVDQLGMAELERFVFRSGQLMRPVFEAAKAAPARIVYAEGEDERVLRAVQTLVDDDIAQPILIGRPAVIAARIERVPVVLDGYVVCAAAAILYAIDPATLDHCIAGHVSAEGAHAEVLRRLGKKPLLDLGMRLGEGSGAALAIGVIQAALNCWKGMATFASAGVSDKA